MYFLQMSFSNARHAGSGGLRIRRTGDNIAKWTMLDEGPEGVELLRLIATARRHKDFSTSPFRPS